MSNLNDLTNAGAASGRFFRLYKAHCNAPNRDTLFSLLDASHSLNDRMKKETTCHFFDFQEFVALNCLRNFFHHQQELRHVVRVIPHGKYPICTDLLTMCLVPVSLVDVAIKSTIEKYRTKARQACQGVFHWYGPIVNINPCLFNFVVLVYERLKIANISLEGDAFEQFEASYLYEEENEIPHFVSGKLSTLAGNVNELLADIMTTEKLS